MRRSRPLLILGALVALAVIIATPVLAKVVKVPICHKYGKPAQKTLNLPYKAAMSHIRAHGDFRGACPVHDSYIDVDGIATTGRGLPGGINVQVGNPLTSWPTPGGNEGIDWFDNDGTCTWTLGDDLHLEDASGACSTAIRDALHNLGFDCQVLDLDGSFFDGQQVDVDLEGGIPFTGCPGVDPLLKFHDANGDLVYNDAEDIVLDGNANGVFD